MHYCYLSLYFQNIVPKNICVNNYTSWIFSTKAFLNLKLYLFYLLQLVFFISVPTWCVKTATLKICAAGNCGSCSPNMFLLKQVRESRLRFLLSNVKQGCVIAHIPPKSISLIVLFKSYPWAKTPLKFLYCYQCRPHMHVNFNQDSPHIISPPLRSSVNF